MTAGGFEVSRAFGPADLPLLDLIASPHVPEGVMYVVDRSSGFEQWSTGPISIREDVWWQPEPWGMTEPALTERKKALGFLEDLLDRMCRDVGLDPELAWRRPRLEERDRAKLASHRWIVEQRIGMSVLNPSSVLKITVT